ncbi:alpha/beta fold hydrolase [Nonomuraea endophytica]|uniref:Pimeloyl-ACP methyl ester carboxylesterase n=1 Tax=Nonomuraea endophytica TaxID=714136 RepID=A0A7W7ZYV8_9ACTN|nr:alpha/beta fold hydrolase [Nonomuraea endophytica]MBB5076381.1 pimeloyl-ACP methyl ester carboxylesterase [Nonomuraea endophytica]
MLSTRHLSRAALTLAATVCLTGLPALAGTAGAATEPLAWKRCATTAKDWPVANDAESECAMLTVPMDHANPRGRTIKIAVSRLKAKDPGRRRGVLVISPGGPGISNITAPASYATNSLGTLTADHDLIGFDPRGVGYSDKINCEEGAVREPPPGASAKARAKAAFSQMAASNKRCTAMDPGFVRQLTTTNIARDVDAIRAALGAPKIGFYGVSYGTAVGLTYRSLFDDRVDRMWVDSVMPPVMDLAAMDAVTDAVGEKSFERFLTWLAGRDAEYHFGTTAAAVRTTIFALRDRLDREPLTAGKETRLDGDWVRGLLGAGADGWAASARDLATVREDGIPRSARTEAAGAQVFGFDDAPLGMNTTQYNAIFCNEGTGGRDFEQVWADAQDRRQRFPGTGGRIEFSSWCAGWPWPARPWQPVKGSSPLQLSGHVGESVTPYGWAVDAQNAVGGTLLTIQDDTHGSLGRLPCAAKAIDFFRTGRTSGGTCPGTR